MTRTGNKWQSDDGRITLLRGDCLKILSRLQDASVDMILTDPPYGHNNNNGDLIHRWEEALGERRSGKCKPIMNVARPILNDGPEANDLFREFLPHARRLLRSCCCCCCCCGGGGGPDPQFARWALWMDEVLSFKQAIIWDKGPMGMGWHYRRSTEMILVAQKGKGRCAWYDQTRKVENIIRPGDYGIRKIIPRETDHPTPKPVALAEHFLRLHSRPGDLVVDPFMGHGWVGVACIRMGRRFLGIELDRDHHRAAIHRIREAIAICGNSAAARPKTAKPGRRMAG